jgi:short-subunit dehydrogenase
LERARMDLQDHGAEVLAVPCDVAKQADVEGWVEQATRHFGQVDILVNNAGVIQVGPVHAQVVEDYETAMAVMYWGVVYPTMAVLPQMRARRRGRIMNITSIGGKLSVPHLSPYCSAKFAAMGFSEGLRAELAQDGITVTTIVPGLMRTGSHLNAWFKGGDWREFAMFAPMASLPVISMDAERAAQQAVAAMKRGEAERTLSLLFSLTARLHGLFPGLTADILGLVNRFLPGADAQPTPYQERGMDIQERLDSTWLETATAWGISAAHRFNQFPGPEGIPAHERETKAA